MKMIDFLAPIAVAIDDESIAALGNPFLFSYFAGGQKQPPSHAFIRLRQVVDRWYFGVRDDPGCGLGRPGRYREKRSPDHPDRQWSPAAHH